MARSASAPVGPAGAEVTAAPRQRAAIPEGTEPRSRPVVGRSAVEQAPRSPAEPPWIAELAKARFASEERPVPRVLPVPNPEEEAPGALRPPPRPSVEARGTEPVPVSPWPEPDRGAALPGWTARAPAAAAFARAPDPERHLRPADAWPALPASTTPGAAPVRLEVVQGRWPDLAVMPEGEGSDLEELVQQLERLRRIEREQEGV